MHLLVRKISEYTGADVFLGIFYEKPEAENALNKYRENYLASPELDPWKEQAYVDEHLSLDQFEIIEIEEKMNTESIIFIVSKYSEAFGQVGRDIDKAYENLKDAQQRCDELDNEDAEFPQYALYQEFKIGEIASDAPDDQPEI